MSYVHNKGTREGDDINNNTKLLENNKFIMLIITLVNLKTKIELMNYSFIKILFRVNF